MIRFFTVAGLSLIVVACTATSVRPVDLQKHRIVHICIRENTSVIVPDFLQVLHDGLERHAITSEIFRHSEPSHCEYTMRYTARQTWDFALLMTDAEIWLDKNNIQIAYAKYHLKGGGGWDLTKWKGTSAKLDPVIDELLAGKPPAT